MTKVIATLAALVALSITAAGSAEARDLAKEFRTGFNPEGQRSVDIRTGVDLDGHVKPDSFRTGVDLNGV